MANDPHNPTDMKLRTKLRSLALAGLVFTAAAALPRRAQAVFTFTLTETAGNVVLNGSGTLNLNALTGSTGGTRPQIGPASGYAFAGSASVPSIDFYTGGGLAGPANFGTGGGVVASSGSGDLAGINGSSLRIVVPSGYVSGNPLTDTATFNGQTFATLGVTRGTYTYTWGTGTTADSFIITTGVPEPSTWALVGMGAAGAGLILRRRAVRA